MTQSLPLKPINQYRIDTRPFDLSRLSKSQFRVAEQVIQHLWVSAYAVEERRQKRSSRVREASGGPWFDFDSRNQNLFIHGARGSGKSSLMLTLLYQLSPTALESARREGGRDAGSAHRLSLADFGDHPGSGTSPEEVPAEAPSIERLERRLGMLRGRVRVLRTLDMEPLAEPTNLLTAVLSRISRAIKNEPGIKQAIIGQLHQLQIDAAISWGGNQETRSASLDPEEYAVAMMRAEYARLDLNERLNQCLEGVSGKWCNH